MIVKIQYCWRGNDKFCYCALIGGGLLVSSLPGETWNRKLATRMLDLIESETGLSRKTIRFRHV